MPRTQPLAFVCADLSEIAKYAIVEKHHYRVLRHYLPGPYCFILEATREVPKLLLTKQKTVGIRVPNHPVPQLLARELGRPLVSTSAQKPGQPNPYVDPREILDDFPNIGLGIDGGPGGTVGTTVVDLTKNPVEVLREGAGELDEFL
jgi:tRNA threonylcarbamoyl adenosine modification protein (Sua5/YciO/YrdC/YwlC family)